MAFFIREFYNNPAGKGATFLNINAIKEKFIPRYNEIAKRVLCSSYLAPTGAVFIHVRIPSSVEGIHYDIVLTFKPNDKSTGVGVEGMDMQIFSNSPSFLYTYAFAYDKSGLLAKEFKKKISSQMFDEIAGAKNPYAILSYDFSVFAALHHVITNGYTNLLNLQHIVGYKNFPELYKAVQHAESLRKNRKAQKDLNKLAKLQEMQRRKNAIKHPKNKDKGESDEPGVKQAPTTKNVKTTARTKTTKTTKKVKRI